VHVGQTGVGQKRLGLARAGARSADEHDVLVEVTAQLTSVFGRQIQRDVAGARDVHRPKLGSGAHVKYSWDVAGVESIAQGSDVEAGGHGADGGLCHNTPCMSCVG
jgi:hypothetical protein